MTDRNVDVEQLAQSDLSPEGSDILRSIVATGRYGPVTIVDFDSPAPFVGRDDPAPMMVELTIAGSPSAVRDKLMSDLGMNTDLLEPWVLIAPPQWMSFTQYPPLSAY